MALDVFVMPLSRYLAGDFVTGAERFAIETGVRYARTADKPAVPIEDARQFVAQLKRQLGREVRWNDEGDTVFAKQFSLHAWHALRYFATDQTVPVPGFIFDGAHPHPGVGTVCQTGRSPYLHLIHHDDHRGFYLPVDFPKPFAVPLGEDPTHGPLAGSSIKLLRELNALLPRIDAAMKTSGEAVARVKNGWTFMQECARLSVQHRLPIIFDG